MNPLHYLQIGLIVLAGTGPAFAEDARGFPADAGYQDVKTWHEQFLRGEPTKAQRLEAMRTIIRESQLGESGLQRIFRNFSTGNSIDPRISGVERSVLLQLSESTSQAKGYRRELLYASAFHNDPRFSLEEMNRFIVRPWGSTDADIVTRHRPTGLYGRVEVKDYSTWSQATNLGDLKVQIDKMAREGRRTGQPQFWINRREVLPDIRRYANKKGIVVLGNVSTGRSSRGNIISSKEALDMLDQEFTRINRAWAISGGAQLIYGAWMLLNAAPSGWEDLQTVWDPATRTTQAWLRVGEHGSYALSGGGMIISGGALLASRFATERLQADLYSLGHWGGVASLLLFGAGEGLSIARYANGDVTSREFWTTQWILGSTGIGSAAGSWIGETAGILVLKNPIWLALLGRTAGAWLGQEIGRRTANTYYERQFAELDQKFGEAVYKHYGVT
jgi:hypothetical protein